MASGSSDGHVAFNNAYSKLSQKTHITKLSIKTRKDNMKTFPNFAKLNEGSTNVDKALPSEPKDI